MAENNDVSVVEDELDAILCGLTPKERTVVLYWDGSAKSTWMALRAAGMDYSKEFVRELCNDIRMVRAIRKYAEMGDPGVLSRRERQQFWSKVVLDDEQRMTDRLKASELLGKSEKDFVDRIEVDATKEFANKLLEARNRLKEVEVSVEDSPLEIEG